MKEKNYEFLRRHWRVHRPDRRDFGRKAAEHEVMLTKDWSLGCPADAAPPFHKALRDFQDYLFESMGLSLRLVHADAPYVLWLAGDSSIETGFVLEADPRHIRLAVSARDSAFRGTVHLEDMMNLEGAPVVPLGKTVRRPLYRYRSVHSGSGIDEYPDAELNAVVHAGYDMIVLFVKEFGRTAAGPCNINDVIRRAESYGLKVMLYNYMSSFRHPDDPGAEEYFDSIYGELFRRYPGAAGICLTGESLEFPSRDPATTGRSYQDSVVDGIPDTRPSPGWYPCCDYPAYLACIERAVHRVKPSAVIVFSTYNWGYAPLELRRRFLEKLPGGISLSVCYEIFSGRRLEGLHTPVMDYTVSATEPGYYFTSESETAHEFGIPVQGNVNTAGIAWDFGCVPYVPAPQRWLKRARNLRAAKEKWGVDSHYATHHYGWWECIAAEIGRWSAWENYEPDYELLFEKIAVRDYGRDAAEHVLAAWRFWSEAMGCYTASNEDQYGPWRVGAAYPFIFHPDISRTMQSREIRFPTAPQAHFGWRIIKTFYHPYENAEQSPGFLRYPAELRALEKMLRLWKKGEAEMAEAVRRSSASKLPETLRLEALGRFIRSSIVTVIHIKQWWLCNMALQTSADAQSALSVLEKIEKIAYDEIENARGAISAVETDSRLGWEPSMEYVCDRWHLEWKIRQVESALREIAVFRKMIRLHLP